MSANGWQEHAACRGINPELWFPVSERADNPIVARARAICAGCRVVEICAEWALNLPLSDGIAGGLTSDERRRIRQAAKAAALESVGAES
jgi:WhiB family redox-sensing transcriptional regulator